MPPATCQISMPLDGDVAGRDQSLESPLGPGGVRPHERVLATDSRRAPHGMDGGGDGAWDESRGSWCGDEPPPDFAVFVLTSSAAGPPDELRLHIAPVLLGASERRPDRAGSAR